MKRITSVAVVILAIVAFRTSVPAYTTNKVNWNLDQVPFYVNPANADVSASAVIDALTTAASGWSMQSNAGVSLYYMGTTTGAALQNNGRNEVFFRNTANGSLVAETYWWADASGHLIDADIVFYDGGFTFFTGTSECVNGVYVEDIATHEFGHALGLSHSSDGSATMYPSTTNCVQNWRSLELDDKLGIEALYPADGLPTIPDAPAGLNGRLIADTTIALAWTDTASNEDGFSMMRSVNGAGWQEIARLAANTQAYTDGSVTPGTTVSYQVKAFNQTGASGSNTVSVSVPAPPPAAPPAPVTNPSPADGQQNVAGKVTLAWAAAQGASAYDVYLGTSASPVLYRSGVTGTSLAVSRLSAGTTYYWRVVARNAAGATSSALWTFRTKAKGKR
jgi:hypothetical protein